MKRLFLSFAIVLLGVLPMTAVAVATPKRTLAGNMNITYNRLPGSVERLSEVVTQGMLYGRLRSNYFYYDWEDEAPGRRKDHRALGLGGSLIVKSGRYQGWAGTLGVYTSRGGLVAMAREDVGLLKSGKDTLSRRKVDNGGNYGLTVLGQAFVEFAAMQTRVVVGRQLFHSLLTQPNDTKMIPNAFDGVSLTTQALPQTELRAAYFVAQKLRDHISNHDVITYQNARGEPWANQDDSAVHKGLSYVNFIAAGQTTQHALAIGTLESHPIDRLTLSGHVYSVPEVLANLSIEANYAWPIGAWRLTPGMRYMRQIDTGGGAIGGAALDGDVDRDHPRGYRSPASLAGQLLALRSVLTNPAGYASVLFGFSRVFDKADLVAPWRGFPTGGYTRAMAQFNWNANTNSYMAQVKLDLGKAGWLPGLRSSLRYAWMDFDEAKGYSDRRIINLDIWQKLPFGNNLEAKLRLGLVEDEGQTAYNEYRFEMNYLF